METENIEFTVKQMNKIMALRVIGIPYKFIKIRFGCKLKDIKKVVKEYPLDMTEEEAVKILLD